MADFDVAVIGLGAMGAAALYHLARSGARAVGLEQAAPGHDGGSSHGESRIIRLAHYENPAYTPLVRRAWMAWNELGRAAGESVVVPTGILEAGPPGAAIVEGSLRAARDHGLPHEQLTPAQANARFPAFDLPAGWSVLYQPDAGIVRADQAIALLVAGAKAAGADIRLGTAVAAIDPGAVHLAGGETLRARAIVVTAGPWITDLVPSLVGRLSLTRQPRAWFTPARPGDTVVGQMPVFLIEDGADAVYGFPDFAGGGVKAASHAHGRRLRRAADARQDAGPEDATPVARALQRFVPGAAGALRAQKTCIYTSTPDEEFVIDFADAGHSIAYASACSGHGFKFASLFGQVLAAMALTGETPPEIAAFSAARFAPRADDL